MAFRRENARLRRTYLLSRPIIYSHATALPCPKSLYPDRTSPPELILDSNCTDRVARIGESTSSGPQDILHEAFWARGECYYAMCVSVWPETSLMCLEVLHTKDSRRSVVLSKSASILDVLLL